MLKREVNNNKLSIGQYEKYKNVNAILSKSILKVKKKKKLPYQKSYSQDSNNNLVQIKL